MPAVIKKSARYFQINHSCIIFRKCHSLLIYCITLLFALILQSCYSSTAEKGTPVSNLVKQKDTRIFKKITARTEKDEIARMSQVKGNKVFVEISGLPEYLIGPLDILEVTSRIGAKKTTDTITVNNRGRISYSFIDDLEISGLTPSQVDRLLAKKMSNYVRNPRIDILVKDFKSKSALVLGEFVGLRATYAAKAGSGRIFLEGKTTLMDLIALAGGYTKDADIRNMRIIRRGKTYIVNLFDIIEKGDVTQNVIIDDGDIVDIPKLPEFGERVYVLGEVADQGIYSLNDAQDLLGAIALAGNVTRLAVEENTLIVRKYEQGEKPLVMMADLKAILRKGDLTQNIPLENGDLIYVPRMLIGDINDWISNTMPLLDFLFYPKRFQDSYFTRDYLHINPR